MYPIMRALYKLPKMQDDLVNIYLLIHNILAYWNPIYCDGMKSVKSNQIPLTNAWGSHLQAWTFSVSLNPSRIHDLLLETMDPFLI